MTPQPPSRPTDYVNQSSGDYLRSQLQAMKNGVYATMVSPDHTKAWDTDQLALQRKINDLAGQTKTGVDPEKLTGPDDFSTLTLEQIRDLSNDIKPDVVQVVSEAWAQIGKTLDDATTALSAGLLKTVGSGWQGQAADAAGKAFGQLNQVSSDNANAASMVGMKVAFAQRGSAETARILGPVLAAAVPSAPLPTVLGSNGKPLAMGAPAIPGTVNIPVLGSAQSQAAQKEEARQACLQVLNNVYAPGIHGGDQGVPALPSAQQIVNPTAPPGPSAPGPSAPGPSVPGQSMPGPAPSNEGGAPSPGSQTPSDQTGNQQPGNADGQQQPTSAQNPGSSNTDTAGYSPSQSSTPGLGTSSPTSTAGVTPQADGGSPSIPGGLGGSAAAALGGLGGGAATGSGGEPGASVAGKPVPTSAAAAAAGPGKAGAAGTPGMSSGSMGHGAQGKGGKDDQEHKSSDLLRGQHLEEWIDDGQRVLPAFGVIGGNPEPPPKQPPSPRDGASGEYR